MSISESNKLTFPKYFRLRDLTVITGRALEFKVNPYLEGAKPRCEEWLRNKKVYEGKQLDRFLSHRFDDFAVYSLPDADQEHLEDFLNFFYWAFAFDDLSDEGDLQADPEGHNIGVEISLKVLRDEYTEPPEFPYAAMLYDIWQRLNAGATPGIRARFTRALQGWCASQLRQSTNRAEDKIMPVEDFIIMRRRTIGGAMVEAMVEYCLHIDLPDHVFEHPVMIAISEVLNDITTWPNDICSFNKEQADGDLQNLVFCVMVERNTDLQGAIDIVTDMVSARVDDYVALKKQLPSWGSHVDSELQRYLKGLEHFVQGTIVWYYSPRYFRDLDCSVRENLLVPVYERSVPVATTETTVARSYMYRGLANTLYSMMMRWWNTTTRLRAPARL